MMRYRRIFIGLTLIAGLAVIAGFNKPDDSIIQKIAGQLDKWSSSHPPEKVYLQFDKPYYAVGDDIWFKAYITLGGRHRLSGLSGVLNVELIDDRDSIKQHIKLPVQSGLTWGDFALSDTLEEGNYRIRAYTNWMRNDGEDYLFEQHITIVNGISNKIFAKAAYTYTTQNGQKKVNALINYTDINGAPYANKEVKYAVEINARIIAKGKGITDDKGNINIGFTNMLVAPLISGRITTSITVADKEVITKTIPVKAVSNDVDVQFFPESGNLITGIISKVAFKAVGADGLGADIKGTIVDDKLNTVAAFSSQHLGMGTFRLDPQPGAIYKAHIIFADGSEKTIDMPKAIDRGYVLAINTDDPDDLRIKVSTSRQILIDNATDTLSLVGQSGGQIYYAAKSNPGSTNFVATVPRSRFPSGIVQFTLFSSKGEPMNERLVFIQNPDQLKLDVSTEKQTYAPQQKVKIKLNARNADGKPVIGSFSVAVIDETKVPVDENRENSIMASMLLTSDLRGYIEQPNYYFNSPTPQTRADLDVLMLTQGYHRFGWEAILNNNFSPITYQPEKTLDISGHITTSGGKPISHGKVTLLSTQKGFFYLDTVTDEQGRFSFKNLVFADSVKFVVQARTGKDRKNVQIDLDNVMPQAVTQNKTAPDIQVSVYDGTSAYLKSNKAFFDEELKYGMVSRTHVLKEVVITATKPKVEHSTNLNGAGNADQVLTSDQIMMGLNDLSSLEGRLIGVTFRNGIPYSTRGGQMAVYLDGMKLQPDELNMINMPDLASIEVLRSISYTAIYGGTGGPGGELILTSKDGSEIYKDNLKRPVPGLITYSPIGYYKARLFYSPQYDDPKTNIPVADLRTTIYWNPNIITDKDGDASFDFFNAGSKGTYRVVIEGIDGDGNLGRQVYRYKVE